MVKAFIAQRFLKGENEKKTHSPKCTVNSPGKYLNKLGHESKPLVFKMGYLKVLKNFTRLFQIMLLEAFYLSLTYLMYKDCAQGNIHSLLLRKKHSRLTSSSYSDSKYFFPSS